MFLNLHSQHISLGLSLHAPPFPPLSGSQHSWLSTQTQKVILQSSVHVQTFQHIHPLQGTSAYVHRDGIYMRESSLYHFPALLHKPEGAASLLWHSSVPPPPLLTAEAAGRHHSLLSDEYFSKRKRSTAALTRNNQKGSLLSHVIL